ncbi:MAG: macrocin O-methyltransferase, partial [Actinobacteria bacterium]|nr:macrocin O-methyltransferase [Actinomycetota bacterium]
IDVDWYEPSLAAWQELYPRVPSGGVIIVDDYGHHSGSKKAFHEFFGSRHPKFTHVDYSCISFVKP